MKFMGTRFRLIKTDTNTVDRGEVIVPVGHWATIGDYYPDAGYVVVYDDNEAGEDMGWGFYSVEELDEQIGVSHEQTSMRFLQ